MIFRTWVDVFLGDIGRYIIDFIANYYYFIIPPVIIYGIFLTISSFNLKRIERAVNNMIVKQSKDIMEKSRGISYVNLVEKIEIDWDRIIKEKSFFPYISQESDLWVSRVSRENVRDLIMNNDSKIRLVLERNCIYIIGQQPEIRKNLYMEFIHRLTRRKY
jgi:hypothetical protein